MDLDDDETMSEAAEQLREAADAAVGIGSEQGAVAELAAYDALLAKWADRTESDPEVRDVYAHAEVNRAGTFAEADDPESAIVAYGEVVDKYTGHEDQNLWRHAIKAAYNRAILLEDVGRLEEAADVYRDLHAGYGEASDTWTLLVVGQGLVNRALLMAKLDGPDAELAAYRQLDEWCGTSELPELRMIAATGLEYTGNALKHLGRHEEQLAVCEEAQRRYGKDTDPEVKEVVGKIVFQRSQALDQLGRAEESGQILADWAFENLEP